MATCPRCDGAAVIAETLTAHVGSTPSDATIDVTLRCDQDHTWMRSGITTAEALTLVRATITESAWRGASHASLGLLLEITDKTDEAYEEYATALRCTDVLDRGFCHERRAAYEAQRGWLRNALRSMRGALADDRRASGARQAVYAEEIAALENAMTERGIAIRKDTDGRWERECELEIPPGFGARNELGEPLAPAVIEIERLVRAQRWDDAVAALGALRSDPARLVDAIGYASRGAELARTAGRLDAAVELQERVVEAYVIYASWSTSGGEGLARTADVDRERERLHTLRMLSAPTSNAPGDED